MHGHVSRAYRLPLAMLALIVAAASLSSIVGPIPMFVAFVVIAATGTVIGRRFAKAIVRELPGLARERMVLVWGPWFQPMLLFRLAADARVEEHPQLNYLGIQHQWLTFLSYFVLFPLWILVTSASS